MAILLSDSKGTKILIVTYPIEVLETEKLRGGIVSQP
jgi:hypothetical protein